jgi:hypothetical protein
MDDDLTITHATYDKVMSRPTSREQAHGHAIDLQDRGFRVHIRQGESVLAYHGDETEIFDGYVPPAGVQFESAPAEPLWWSEQ